MKSNKTTKFTVQRLNQIHKDLQTHEKQNYSKHVAVVELLRELAEVLVWGDQHDDTFFDVFLEKNMLFHFLRIVRAVSSNQVKVQIIQTLTLIITNVSKQTSLYVLLSGNHINNLMRHQFDWNDEEIVSNYISFLKSLSLRLNNDIIQLFYDKNKGEFPLYTESIKFYNHYESMVKTSTRTIVLNIMSLSDEAVIKYLTNNIGMFFGCTTWQVRETCCSTYENFKESNRSIRNSFRIPNPKKSNVSIYEITSALTDQYDTLLYFNDIYSRSTTTFSQILSNAFLHILILPFMYASYGGSASWRRAPPSGENPYPFTTALVDRKFAAFLFSQIFISLQHPNAADAVADISGLVTGSPQDHAKGERRYSSCDTSPDDALQAVPCLLAPSALPQPKAAAEVQQSPRVDEVEKKQDAKGGKVSVFDDEVAPPANSSPQAQPATAINPAKQAAIKGGFLSSLKGTLNSPRNRYASYAKKQSEPNSPAAVSSETTAIHPLMSSSENLAVHEAASRSESNASEAIPSPSAASAPVLSSLDVTLSPRVSGGGSEPSQGAADVFLPTPCGKEETIRASAGDSILAAFPSLVDYTTLATSPMLQLLIQLSVDSSPSMAPGGTQSRQQAGGSWWSKSSMWLKRAAGYYENQSAQQAYTGPLKALHEVMMHCDQNALYLQTLWGSHLEKEPVIEEPLVIRAAAASTPVISGSKSNSNSSWSIWRQKKGAAKPEQGDEGARPKSTLNIPCIPTPYMYNLACVGADQGVNVELLLAMVSCAILEADNLVATVNPAEEEKTKAAKGKDGEKGDDPQELIRSRQKSTITSIVEKMASIPLRRAAPSKSIEATERESGTSKQGEQAEQADSLVEEVKEEEVQVAHSIIQPDISLLLQGMVGVYTDVHTTVLHCLLLYSMLSNNLVPPDVLNNIQMLPEKTLQKRAALHELAGGPHEDGKVRLHAVFPFSAEDSDELLLKSHLEIDESGDMKYPSRVLTIVLHALRKLVQFPKQVRFLNIVLLVKLIYELILPGTFPQLATHQQELLLSSLDICAKHLQKRLAGLILRNYIPELQQLVLRRPEAQVPQTARAVSSASPVPITTTPNVPVATPNSARTIGLQNTPPVRIDRASPKVSASVQSETESTPRDNDNVSSSSTTPNQTPREGVATEPGTPIIPKLALPSLPVSPAIQSDAGTPLASDVDSDQEEQLKGYSVMARIIEKEIDTLNRLLETKLMNLVSDSTILFEIPRANANSMESKEKLAPVLTQLQLPQRWPNTEAEEFQTEVRLLLAMRSLFKYTQSATETLIPQLIFQPTPAIGVEVDTQTLSSQGTRIKLVPVVNGDPQPKDAMYLYIFFHAENVLFVEPVPNSGPHKAVVRNCVYVLNIQIVLHETEKNCFLLQTYATNVQGKVDIKSLYVVVTANPPAAERIASRWRSLCNTVREKKRDAIVQLLRGKEFVA